MRELKIALAVLVLGLGCSRVEAPSKTAADVASARQDAREDVNEAVDEARSDVAKGDETAAKAQYDVLITKLEGDHKVRIEACEGLPADQQGACKDKADTELEIAKGQAQTVKSRL